MEPGWFAAALLVEAASFVCIWELQRIALQTKSWYGRDTSQLAGNALGRVIPGGMAASGTLQYQMLIRAGLPSGRIASALASVSVLTFGTVLALPLLSLPAIIGGTPRGQGLAQAAYLGAGLFVLVLIGGILVFVWDRPLRVVGRAATRVLNRTIRRKHHVDGLAERLLHERDSLRVAFGALEEGSRRGRRQVDLEYLALVAAVRGCRRGAQPLAGAPRLRRRGLPGDDPADPGRPGLRRGGPDGPPRPRRRLSRRRRGDPGLPARHVLASIPAGGVAYLLFRHRYP